jgi:hypothetical protein
VTDEQRVAWLEMTGLLDQLIHLVWNLAESSAAAMATINRSKLCVTFPSQPPLGIFWSQVGLKFVWLIVMRL